MKLTEVTDLISIKQYLANVINSSTIDRQTVNYISGALILIDNKILGLLQEQDFKKYIGYKDVQKAIKEVADLNNIKSGMVK